MTKIIVASSVLILRKKFSFVVSFTKKTLSHVTKFSLWMRPQMKIFPQELAHWLQQLFWSSRNFKLKSLNSVNFICFSIKKMFFMLLQNRWKRHLIYPPPHTHLGCDFYGISRNFRPIGTNSGRFISICISKSWFFDVILAFFYHLFCLLYVETIFVDFVTLYWYWEC